MSMSGPSIIFHQGLRCTKVPRKSATIASPPTSFPVTPTPSDKPILSTDPTPVVETSSLSDPTTVSTLQGTESESTTATSTATSTATPTQLPLVGSFTTLTALSGLSSSITEGNPETYSLVSSYDSGYPTLEPSASNVSSRLLSLGSSEAFTTRTSLIKTTATSTATGGGFHKNDSNPSDDSGTSATLRTLLGSIFGAMVFIAIVFLIFLLIFKYKQKKSGRNLSVSGNEKLLKTDRQSGDSSTILQHGSVSASSIRSHDDNYAPDARTNPHYQGPTDAASAHYSDPFSDFVQGPGGSRISMHKVEDTIQSLSMHLKYDPNPSLLRANLPQRTVSGSILPTVHGGGIQSGSPLGPDQRSIYSSERSLGSTLILPGRSSLGSSFQGFNYRASVAELEPLGTNEIATKISPRSTRSDPFDLEVPAKAVHPLGSVTQPRSQV
ncbi:hypothetical protein BDV28DRAFT_140022 [Aspergillus coremiiformis]|uniref:Uncharacterized protein n=1 Tax=Aspergillus coremiiformis TaxID=138285 RepID=A0A5N6YX22_9EURO|nr:hypothetical protein BDV28DRAFT_140022 [Aspergillus coremiiformis]